MSKPEPTKAPETTPAETPTAEPSKDVASMGFGDYLNDDQQSSEQPQSDSPEERQSAGEDDDQDQPEPKAPGDEAQDEDKVDPILAAIDEEATGDEPEESEAEDDEPATDEEDYSSLTQEQAIKRLSEKDKGVAKLKSQVAAFKEVADNHNSWLAAFDDPATAGDAFRDFGARLAKFHNVDPSQFIGSQSDEVEDDAEQHADVERALDTMDFEFEGDRDVARKTLIGMKALGQFPKNPEPPEPKEEPAQATPPKTRPPADQIVKKHFKTAAQEMRATHNGFVLTPEQMLAGLERFPTLDPMDAITAHLVKDIARHTATVAASRKKPAPAMIQHGGSRSGSNAPQFKPGDDMSFAQAVAFDDVV